MNQSIAKAIIQDCKDRGYVEVAGVFYPPDHPKTKEAVKPIKRARNKSNLTGWIDDSRNIKNKLKRDVFTMLMQKEGLDCWPEFYFSTERLYRFDYALPTMANSPQLKIAVECEGGIWAKGNSGHSSGIGIQRDMDKNNLALSQGWVIIRRTPSGLCTNETIELIKSVIKQRL